ncbi:hypothetical protein L6452_43524 [Arctium lappa]|uniref:Uncharacterized protein n=1 Tax=Arctium lappa TaxID=4217 RepID=A0ACB8XCS0_ARCLA|nr:hypothetical protein L6452_43524 [Arctium lappa]
MPVSTNLLGTVRADYLSRYLSRVLMHTKSLSQVLSEVVIVLVVIGPTDFGRGEAAGLSCIRILAVISPQPTLFSCSLLAERHNFKPFSLQGPTGLSAYPASHFVSFFFYTVAWKELRLQFRKGRLLPRGDHHHLHLTSRHSGTLSGDSAFKCYPRERIGESVNKMKARVRQEWILPLPGTLACCLVLYREPGSLPTDRGGQKTTISRHITTYKKRADLCLVDDRCTTTPSCSHPGFAVKVPISSNRCFQIRLSVDMIGFLNCVSIERRGGMMHNDRFTKRAKSSKDNSLASSEATSRFPNAPFLDAKPLGESPHVPKSNGKKQNWGLYSTYSPISRTAQITPYVSSRPTHWEIEKSLEVSPWAGELRDLLEHRIGN